MEDPGTKRGGRTRQAALLVAAALFMESLDGTIIATALPHMARSFAVGPLDLDIGVTAYLLAVGVGIPLSGWVADRVGGRRLFTGAMLLFGLASLACAASGTLIAFVAARIVQGLAAAMMTPVGRIIILRETPRDELVHTMALLTWPALLAPAIAPPLGGLVVEHLSWRWIFLANMPIGLAGAMVACRVLPEDPVAPPSSRPDLRGWLLWCGACGLLVGLAGQGGRLPPLWLGIGALLCIVTGAAAAGHFRRAPKPLLDLTMVSAPSFAHAMAGGSLVRMAILANPFLLPLLLQLGLGYSPAMSGVLILIGMSGNIAMKFATTPILRRFSYRSILLANGLFLSAGFAGLAMVGRDMPTAGLVLLLLLTGFGRSMHFTALNTLAFSEVPPERISGASTLSSAVQQVNAALGVALVALTVELSALIAGRGGHAMLTDYRAGFGAIALLSLAGTLDALRLAPRHRALFGRKERPA